MKKVEKIGKWYLIYTIYNSFEGSDETIKIGFDCRNQDDAIKNGIEALNKIITGAKKEYERQRTTYVNPPKSWEDFDLKPKSPSIIYEINISDDVKEEYLTPIQSFWKNLYKNYFNLDINASLIKEREGKWEIFIAKGLTMQQVYDALPFAKWKYIDGDLDMAVPTNDRTSDKDYVVYVDQNIEADEKFKNKSANDLKKMKHTGITLLERLILELKYFEETREHLDVYNITLCSGSRDSDGGVPSVDWSGDELGVDWDGTSNSNGNLRSRSVVSA